MQEPVLTFPVTWEFRIVATMRPELVDDIRAALFMLGFRDEVTAGRMSRGGKYRTYHVAVTLPDRITMNALSHSLAGIPGVRMVL